MAAAKAIASLAREPVTEGVKQAYEGREMVFGREYILPTPFDSRLLPLVSIAVAKAAIESGIAKIIISDWNHYEETLKARTAKISPKL